MDMLKAGAENYAGVLGKRNTEAVLVGNEQEVEVEERWKAFFEVLHAAFVKGFTEGL